ncbi:MAG: DMT family transporter [Gemmatimonadales bacterium]
MTPRQAALLLIAACAIWGASFPVVKAALGSASPLAFVAVRFALATLVLAPGAGLRALRPGPELAGGLLLGVLLGVGFATQAVGLVTTTPSRSAFIIAISSIIAPFVATAVAREPLRAPTAGALALATAGLYLLTAPDAGGLNRGDLWTVATALVFGVQIVAVRELGRRYSPDRLVWLQIATTAVAVAIAAALLERPHIRWAPGVVAALTYTGVVATAVALRWQMHAQRHMSSARAALLFCFEPVFAAMAAWLWLGERLSVAQWTGGALILAGMVAADLPGGRRSVELGRPRAHIWPPDPE